MQPCWAKEWHRQGSYNFIISMPQSQIEPFPSVKLLLARSFSVVIDALHVLHTDANVWMFCILKPSNLACLNIRFVGNGSIMYHTNMTRTTTWWSDAFKWVLHLDSCCWSFGSKLTSCHPVPWVSFMFSLSVSFITPKSMLHSKMLYTEFTQYAEHNYKLCAYTESASLPLLQSSNLFWNYFQ